MQRYVSSVTSVVTLMCLFISNMCIDFGEWEISPSKGVWDFFFGILGFYWSFWDLLGFFGIFWDFWDFLGFL